MPIVNGYTTTAALQSWVTIDDVQDDTKLELAINAASRAIDQFCQRRFWKDAADTTRTYVPGSWFEVKVDDLVSVTTLKTDEAGDGTFETTWASSDFQLHPVNPEAFPETHPYTKIRAVGTRTFPVPYIHLARADRVQIVGIFGWPAVPHDIEQACLLLASRFFSRRNSPTGTAGFGEFGPVRISREDVDMVALLNPYRKHAAMIR